MKENPTVYVVTSYYGIEAAFYEKQDALDWVDRKAVIARRQHRRRSDYEITEVKVN